ncbi:MAG: tyrosine--tRNA ligase [Chloroflexi bacterium]|nr:MAG: tyrosine--tRNA ligase [Chloroflexota bacterium]
MPRAGARGRASFSIARSRNANGLGAYPVTVPAPVPAKELDEFLSRAVSGVSVLGDLRNQLASGERQLRIKQGFDPTAKNLHLGHAISLRKLRKLSRWGHEIVLIVGDWTTQIGDPTDRDLSRPLKSRDEVLANAQTYLDQFHLVVPRENTRVVLQDEWYGKFGLRDVIELASRFTAQQMLAREEFRKRIEKKTPIPIKDLLYPLLQAYDSVAIAADVEFGGTDQLFNILAGRELQEMVGQPPQSVFIVELLEGLDGDQMHKSKPATAIWLTDPPSEIYGKVMSIDDSLMPHYYEWATELPMSEVRATIEALARKELHPREAKRKLARAITAELHSVAAAEEAEREFDRVHKEGGAPEDMPEVTVAIDGAKEIAIVDLLVLAKLRPSKGEARRAVDQGGVTVDDHRATLDTKVPVSGAPVVRVGKRHFARIRFR